MKQDHDDQFVQFATARGAHLLRTAFLLTGDWHLAEDLVQESLAKMYAAWRGVDRIDNPAAYAQTVLMRTFLSYRRRRSNSETPHADPPEAGRDDADVALRVSLLNALAELKPKDRAILVLRYWEDRSVDDVADMLGLTNSAVRNQSGRALARLRDLLGAARYADFAELGAY